MTSLRCYPRMRPSGLPWVGDIPDHWQLTPNRAVLSQRKILVGAAFNDFKLLSLTKAGVVVRDVSTGRGKFSADMGTCQEVRSGDLILCLFDVPETPRTVGLSSHNGMITGAYTILECNDPTLAQFLEAFYVAMDNKKLLSPLYSGLRNTIPPSRFLGTKTPVPTPSEQAAIVRFLSHADRRIRRYVHAKEKLIKVLEEQKQAIIQQAVTGKIDVRTGQPYRAYRDSKVAWLREIPRHWETRRLKYLLRETDSRSESGAEPLLRVSQYTGVTERRLGLAAGERETRASSLVGYKIVERNELAVNIMLAWNGSMGVAPLRGIVSPAYCVYRFGKNVQPWYYHYLLRSPIYKAYIKTVSTGVVESRLRLYTDDLYRLYGLLPPLGEQNAIVRFLARATRTADHAVERTRKQLDLVREYCHRLIADVVTGKLDVREAAASLPEVDLLNADDPHREPEAKTTAEPEGLGLALHSSHP